MRLNANALLTSTLGLMAVMGATGKRIPEPLILVSFLTSVAALIQSTSEITTPAELAGCGPNCNCAPCKNNYGQV